jgi:hypothetical protein
MRDRSFLQAGEQVRPFSEVRREREFGDVALIRRRALLEQVQRLEAEAKVCGDRKESIRLQLEAEALRCRLHEEESLHG